MSSVLSRSELRRLEKAAREKDKKHLMEWAVAYDKQVEQDIQRQYDEALSQSLANSYDTLMLTLAYSLCTDPNVSVKKNTMEIVLDRFYRNITNFISGKFKRQDYETILKNNGIQLKDYSYEHRLTSIVALVFNEEEYNQKEKAYEYFRSINYIVIELDNFRGTDDQIKKNVEIINMCDMLYCIGNSEHIEIYKKYAELIKKPWRDGSFIYFDENEIWKELEE